jgi:hypothetical protein
MSVAEHMSNPNLSTWTAITAIKIVEKKENKSGTDNGRAVDYTPYLNASTGEVAFALVYPGKKIEALTEAESEFLAFDYGRRDGTTMETICQAGNRRDSMRTKAYLPDSYVFNYACKHSLEIRGLSPKTFEEYLRIVNSLEVPATRMSVHSPGVNQQFSTTAAIMAEPTKMAPPPTEEEQEEQAPKIRKKRKPAAKKAVPKPEKEEAKKSPSPPKRIEPEEPTKAEPAPKRKKKKAKSEASEVSLVLQAIYSKVESVVDNFSASAIANLKKSHEFESVTGQAYGISTGLSRVAAIFAMITYAHIEKQGTCTFTQIFETPTTPIQSWNDETFEMAVYIRRQLSASYQDFQDFVTKGLCHRKGNSTSRTIYDHTIVALIKELQSAEDMGTKISEILKSLNGPENHSKKLMLYFISLRGTPETTAEPKFEF